jgi:hypothetical protein
MSSLDDWRNVATASLGLPDKRLLDVVKLVEQAPDRGRVCEVLDRIRPRLVRLRPPRALTVQRLLFRPVEDLFDPVERYRAKIGRLSRQIVQPCWTIIRALVAPPLLRRTDERLRTIDILDPNEVFATGLPLWQTAAEQLSTFLATDAGIGRCQVGTEQVTITEDVRQQLLNIAEILALATEVETVKLHLSERPIGSLSQVDIDLLSTIISRLAADSTRKVQTFVLVLLARMARPGDLLQVLADMALPCSSAEHAGLFKAVGSNALAALTYEAQDLRQQRNKVTDPISGAETAEHLVTRLMSFERTLGGLRDRTVTEQIHSARRDIGTFVLDTVVAKANQELFQTLAPPQGPATRTGPAEPTVEQVEKAEKCALSLRRCARVTEAIGLRREMEQRLAIICAELERQAHPAGAEADEPLQSRQMIRSARLIELLAGPDEAQRMLTAQLPGRNPAP